MAERERAREWTEKIKNRINRTSIVQCKLKSRFKDAFSNENHQNVDQVAFSNVPIKYLAEIQYQYTRYYACLIAIGISLFSMYFFSLLLLLRFHWAMPYYSHWISVLKSLKHVNRREHIQSHKNGDTNFVNHTYLPALRTYCHYFKTDQIEWTNEKLIDRLAYDIELRGKQYNKLSMFFSSSKYRPKRTWVFFYHNHIFVFFLFSSLYEAKWFDMHPQNDRFIVKALNTLKLQVFGCCCFFVCDYFSHHWFHIIGCSQILDICSLT